jgi:hypothetical protein
MPVPDVVPAESVGMSTERLQMVRSVTRGYVDHNQKPNCQCVIARAVRCICDVLACCE